MEYVLNRINTLTFYKPVRHLLRYGPLNIQYKTAVIQRITAKAAAAAMHMFFLQKKMNLRFLLGSLNHENKNILLICFDCKNTHDFQ